MRDCTIQSLDVIDVRFPTSDDADGSDAMHTDPDYSAAYVRLGTSDSGLEGAGLTFTIGRGNELCVAACKSLAPMVVGKRLSEIARDMAGFWRQITSDSQLRWVGPEKGVLHLATAAVVNAVWDLWAKAEGKPLWKLVADLSPQELLNCLDLRYLHDVLPPAEALRLLEQQREGQADRLAELEQKGFPAYTTSAGWLGYSDEKIRRLCTEGMAEGWNHFKIKVGRDLEDDLRRATVVRETIGDERFLMMDANQIWEVPEAIANMKELARFNPWWIEEPTSPDDVLGHATIAKAIDPIGVATGEQCQNRVIFKQLLQAEAIRFCQIDSCRLGGVNEVLAVMLLAKRFDVPVCPHAGGVGLCEYVNHLIMIDHLSIGARTDDRIAEFVDHLHEHFVNPCVVKDGAYTLPQAPGYSIDMHFQSLERYAYPHGAVWKERA
ncbi:MAG: L-fuconate dehydratase [Planctomycetota bacterium]|jgi:L-fuconate dehydratase